MTKLKKRINPNRGNKVDNAIVLAVIAIAGTALGAIWRKFWLREKELKKENNKALRKQEAVFLREIDLTLRLAKADGDSISETLESLGARLEKTRRLTPPDTAKLKEKYNIQTEDLFDHDSDSNF